MGIEWTKVRLRQARTLALLKMNRPVPLSNFSRIKTVRDKEKPFQYVVQVETTHRRRGDRIFRTITVSEGERGNLEDILQDAADALMNSPVSAREQFVEARIIKAQRFRI